MHSPIVTSIPPVFSRRDAQGNEIGEAYLGRCITSWRDCGFTPVTVNSESEALHPVIGALDVKVLRVPRDASALTGRPHVFLEDFLDAALGLGSARVFIVNADIELEMTEGAKARLHALEPGQAFAAHRHDHSGDKTAPLRTYTGGIDLIGADRAGFEGLASGKLVFGMPWWDHYLPLMLLGRDAEFISGDGVQPWHLDHDGRWNKQHRIDFGDEFLRLSRQAATGILPNPDISQHMARFEQVAHGQYGDTALAALKARALALFPSTRAHKRHMLREVSVLDEALLRKISGV